MKRRAILATIGSAATLSVAGCTRVGSIPSPDTDRRMVELESVEGVPAKHEVKMEVEILGSAINADQTAILEVSTTNTGERRTIPVAPDKCSLFNRSRGGSDHPKGLWLHRAGSTSHIDRQGDRWVADRPADEPRLFHDYGCAWGAYETGETVTNEYEIWDDYRIVGYMDPGTYRWEERVNISKAEGQGEEDDELGSFHWGFDIELSVPDEA